MVLDHRKMVTQRLGQAARAFRSRAGAYLAEFDLHAGQETVLKILATGDGISMSELAAELGVQPPTVTKMVSRLAVQGYLTRKASNGDGRQTHVFLTANGRKVVDSIDGVMQQLEDEALAGIDDKDRRRLRRLLKQVERNLTDAEGEESPEKSSRRDLEIAE